MFESDVISDDGQTILLVKGTDMPFESDVISDDGQTYTDPTTGNQIV